MSARAKPRVGGRPPKFDEPRRPVTMTLPDRTLGRLAAIDSDRAAAIVKLVEATEPSSLDAPQGVDVVEVAPGAAVILVGPSRTLREIPWLRLAEVSPRRFLLTVVPGTPVESIEVALFDLLERLAPEEADERAVLEELRRLISASRRERHITKFEMLYVPPRPERARRRRPG